jgi:hypothetical protein
VIELESSRVLTRFGSRKRFFSDTWSRFRESKLLENCADENEIGFAFLEKLEGAEHFVPVADFNSYPTSKT